MHLDRERMLHIGNLLEQWHKNQQPQHDEAGTRNFQPATLLELPPAQGIKPWVEVIAEDINISPQELAQYHKQLLANEHWYEM